ncbi:unnamed protein product [Darwinula stevensoni]|uniref:DUF7869 domain-containing protein n=1 Tax=Darwinula stevensoni TaxID=69355 RepID=A0A7R9AEL3_9CRUS|nr:unnamed protein product [Darwinula stevensoni]CAG0902101.1 unnamed protein product [Darwinula stevensoni]
MVRNICFRTRKDSEEAPKGGRILNSCPFGDQQRMHKDSLPMLLSRDAFTISCSPMNMKNSIYQRSKCPNIQPASPYPKGYAALMTQNFGHPWTQWIDELQCFNCHVCPITPDRLAIFQSIQLGDACTSATFNSSEKNRIYRYKCCLGKMEIGDLHEMEEVLTKMTKKDKMKLLVDLISQNSSRSRKTVSCKEVEWVKLQRRQISQIPKCQRRKPKKEFVHVWLWNFLSLHGQHSPCPTKKIFVQGFTEQRSNYMKHKVLAIDDSDWVTMVVDGMDQNKTNIPRFAEEDRQAGSLPKIITHISGVMVYSRKGIREFAFVDQGEYPHDSNLCAGVILRSLLHVRHDLKSKLFLQMDNCARENKNKYICALAHMLVETGIFKEGQTFSDLEAFTLIP